MATARSDERFLEYHEPSFQQWTWKVASKKLSVIDNVLGALEYVKLSLRQIGQNGCEELDEKTMANLEYLLLRIRECLAQTTVAKAWRFIKNSMSRHHHPMERLFKYGGDKWCSEFSGNQRPMSTTWPWSIRPSLAVIWGVCWMFEMKREYNQWFWPSPSQGEVMGSVPAGESIFLLHPTQVQINGSPQPTLSWIPHLLLLKRWWTRVKGILSKDCAIRQILSSLEP